jgi:hypothetical protein
MLRTSKEPPSRADQKAGEYWEIPKTCSIWTAAIPVTAILFLNKFENFSKLQGF